MADLTVPSDKIEAIKDEMQKEFDNIINEVYILTKDWFDFESFRILHVLFVFSAGTARTRDRGS